MDVRRRVLVRGRVQGVFFRDSLRERAERAGVSGWVSNLDDGSVEAVLEGSGDAVDSLIEFCRTGPPRATVADLKVSDEAPEGLVGFRIQ